MMSHQSPIHSAEETQSTSSAANAATHQNLHPSLEERLITFIGGVIEPMGFEVVHLEVIVNRQKLLRLFIDQLGGAADEQKGGITLQNCVDVTRALDEPLEKFAEIDSVFKGAYELEVSSPGVDRPLRQAKDYARFAGREARIHVFRPLSAEELANADYQQKNPRQKNFVGVLKGVENGKVLLAVSTQSGDKGSGKKKTASKNHKKNGEGPNGTAQQTVAIPLPLISKANLEPKFDFDSKEEAIEL